MDEMQIVRAHTLAVQELNQTLVDLLARMESQQPAPDLRDLLAGLSSALQKVQAPQISAPVNVSAELRNPVGGTWTIDAKRKIDGFEMTVVKVA